MRAWDVRKTSEDRRLWTVRATHQIDNNVYDIRTWQIRPELCKTEF